MPGDGLTHGPPATVRPGPYDFAVRACHVRLACHPRPSHPRLTCRDDRAYVPLHRGGMREKKVLICPTEQARTHAADWHDGQLAHGVHAVRRRRARLASDRFREHILQMAARDYTTVIIICPICNKIGIVDVSTADHPRAKTEDFRVECLPEGFGVRRPSKSQYETQFECTNCKAPAPYASKTS
jgi:hypothetical protein